MSSEAVTLPSERSFGLLFSIIFSVVAGYAAWLGWSSMYRIGFGSAAVALFVVAMSRPTLLRPFNKAWFAIGAVLGRIVNPIVVGALFFLLITPVALVTRLAGRDALGLRFSASQSYWILRSGAAVPASFKRQF